MGVEMDIIMKAGATLLLVKWVIGGCFAAVAAMF